MSDMCSPVECEQVKNLWDKMRKYCFERYGEEFVVTPNTIIFNDMHVEPSNYMNLLIVIFKQKLYASKCDKKIMNAECVIEELEFIHEKQYRNAVIAKKVRNYNKTWPDKIDASIS